MDFTIIVSGIPRSGTSLMMRILERAGVSILSDGVRRPDDDNPHGYYELEAVKRLRDDASCIDDARGRAVKVIHTLLPHLPADRRYRVLLMRRDLDEVLDSQAQMLTRANGSQGTTVSREGDRRLRQAFANQLVRIDAFLARHACFDVQEVDYNRLLADPEPELAKVVRFLGLNIGVRELAEVIDPTLYRQRSRCGP